MLKGVVGDTYIEELRGNENTDVRVVRIIQPIGFGWMIRVDLVMSKSIGNAATRRVLIYQRGDKAMEQKALEGDRA